MEENLMTVINNASDAELDAIAARHGITMPKEFVASDPRAYKAEYLAEKLGLTTDESTSETTVQATYDAGVALDKAVQKIQEKHPSLSYHDALGIARRQNAGLSEQAFPTKRIH
jgi:hypothetical protein